MCIDITMYYIGFLYSFTYSHITIPCNIIFIMGVQLRNEFVVDLDFGITNSDSSEGRIFQIDFDNALPLVNHVYPFHIERVHSLGIRSVRNYTF